MNKVLHIVSDMRVCGGIQSFIMNVYRTIDRSKIQFDFLLNEHIEISYEEEIKALGGNIYFFTKRRKGILKTRSELNAFFKEHQYAIIHYHMPSLSNVDPLIVAKRNGIKTRIVHSHSTNIMGKYKYLSLFLHYLHKRSIKDLGTVFLACSEKAKLWAFGNTKVEDKAQIIYNGIDLDIYKRNKKEDDEFRESLNIAKDNFVICHVGSFDKVKNHEFLIQIFQKVNEKNKKALLVLVGDGEQFKNISKKIEKANLKPYVRMLGVRKDVNRILRIADAFVFPSFFEGFGNALLEAEAAGLPCVVSSGVQDEAIINKNVYKLNIKDTPDKWAECILNNTNIVEFVDTNIDVKTTIKKLIDIYQENFNS